MEKPLQLNQVLMTLFIIPTAAEAPWYIRRCRQVIVYLALLFTTFGYGASIDFIIKYLKTDVGSALYAVYQVAAEFGASYSILIALLLPKALQNIFSSIQHVRETGEI